jgi:putative transposase
MRCQNHDFRPGSIFHLFNHAVDDQLLFYDDQDYNFFLIAFSNHLRITPATVIAYCLMPNHYHFLLRQDDEDKIYRIFNYSFISYARYYNRKYERKGHIFRSPLQHKIVDNPTYLLQLCKYIHLNPVYAGIVDNPKEWEYSNYKEWINERTSNFFSKEIRQKYFPRTIDYITYVNSFHNFVKNRTFRNLKIDTDLSIGNSI